MGVLTVAMTGLRDAIVSSRQARMALLGDLARGTDERRNGVSTLCAGFARDRAGAHRAWFGPLLFESRTAQKHQQQTEAKTQEPAPKAEPRTQKPAHRPVAARAPHPSAAPLPRAQRTRFKGSKKH